MLAQDNDEKLMITAGGFEDDLVKYSIPRQFFSALKNKGKVSKYSFNPSLMGVKLNQVKNPQSMVLIYEGHDDEPEFRYQGRAAIAFADGSVRMVTPQRS